MKEFDVCIVGSGAGAGPVAYELSLAGYSVAVLEKGKWFKESDFSKDELKNSLRDAYSPNLKDEFHVIEDVNSDGSLDVLIQHTAPEADKANWLPAPAGKFAVTMRLYMPEAGVLDGSWRVPPLERMP